MGSVKRARHQAFAPLISSFYRSRSSKGHHKSDDSNADKNIIVRIYYGNYFFFGYCCVAQETFYLLLYVLFFEPSATLPEVAGVAITLQQLCWYATGPGFVFKQIANVGQMCSATDFLIKRQFDNAGKSK